MRNTIRAGPAGTDVRPVPWLLLGLVAVTFVPTTEAVGGGCEGTWTVSATCNFVCGSAIAISGTASRASASIAPAVIQVVAECGLTIDGAFSVVRRLECAGERIGVAECRAVQVQTLGFALEGRCHASGVRLGTYACES